MSIEPEAIKSLIQAHLPDAEVTVTGDGYHFEARVVSTQFEGLRPVQKQQKVYQAVQPQIADGTIHALSIKALTPDEVA